MNTTSIDKISKIIRSVAGGIIAGFLVNFFMIAWPTGQFLAITVLYYSNPLAEMLPRNMDWIAFFGVYPLFFSVILMLVQSRQARWIIVAEVLLALAWAWPLYYTLVLY